VARGLGRIDEILEQTRLTNQDIELCLATGGMVNMPAIRNGLTERFIGRVPTLNNSDRIIAEGAAWIANDDLRLTLAKPIELLIADTSGSGTYYPLVPAGLELPMENKVIPAADSRLFCVDPHPQRIGVRLTVKQHRMRTHDKQFAQVPIAHLRNTPELLLAARRVLLRRQREKGGELARAGEAGRILNGRRHRRGGDRAEAGNATDTARCSSNYTTPCA